MAGKKKSKRCGPGRIYDNELKKCRRYTYDEKQQLDKASIKGYVAGGAIASKVKPGSAGALVAGAAGGYLYGRARKKKQLREKK